MHKIYFLYKIKLINKNIFFMTNLDKSLNNYITHIKFLNLDAVNYYFIAKCHKNYIKNKKMP